MAGRDGYISKVGCSERMRMDRSSFAALSPQGERTRQHGWENPAGSRSAAQPFGDGLGGPAVARVHAANADRERSASPTSGPCHPQPRSQQASGPSRVTGPGARPQRSRRGDDHGSSARDRRAPANTQRHEPAPGRRPARHPKWDACEHADEPSRRGDGHAHGRARDQQPAPQRRATAQGPREAIPRQQQPAWRGSSASDRLYRLSHLRPLDTLRPPVNASASLLDRALAKPRGEF